MIRLKLNHKEKIALTVTAIAACAWLVDAVSKHWAEHNVPKSGTLVVPNLLYFFAGVNHGGSNGIPADYMEFCLVVPALVMFMAAAWLGKSLRKGKPFTFVQQLAIGLFFGGALANWSQRVVHGGVTDFILLKPVGFCIFNLADVFIDLGYTILIFESLRLFIANRNQSLAESRSSIDA